MKKKPSIVNETKMKGEELESLMKNEDDVLESPEVPESPDIPESPEVPESPDEPESPDDIDDPIFREFERLFGQQVLIVTESDQLNLLGQTFRPIFCGPIVEVTLGHVTIYPANIKLLNAPFYQFPTPLSIPLERIAQFTPNFDCNERIPLI